MNHGNPDLQFWEGIVVAVALTVGVPLVIWFFVKVTVWLLV